MPNLIDKSDLRQSLRPHTQELLQKLEAIEMETSGHTHTGNSRWMIPYADLLTLLLGFFVVMFALAKSDPPIPDPNAAPIAAEAAMAETAGEEFNNPAELPITTAGNAEENDEMTVVEDTRLQEELQDLLAPGIAVSRQERGVVISLKDSILFAPGSAELTPAARRTIDQLADRLVTGMGAEPRPIRVEGHTDNTPITTAKYPSNWELSTARATTIVKYLVDSHQLPPQQLSAAGYGEFRPVANNSSIEGKHKNRRVDIVILNRSAAKSEPANETATAEPELNE